MNTQITNIRNERNISTGHMAIKRIIKEYYEQQYTYKFDTSEEMKTSYLKDTIRTHERRDR